MCSILFLQCVSTNLVLVKIRSRIYFDNFFDEILSKVNLSFNCWRIPVFNLIPQNWSFICLLVSLISNPLFWKVILRNFALIDVWFFDLLWTHWIGINFCWLKLQISKTWNYSSLSFLKWHSTSIKSGDQWPIWSLFDDD